MGGTWYDEFTTNSENQPGTFNGENGTVFTPLEMDPGKYALVELKTPDGFLLPDGEVPFEIGNIKDYTQDADGDYYIEVVMKNAQPKGEINLTKKIEVDANGKANVESLQSVMDGLFGKSAEMRTLNIKAEASMNIDGEALFLGSEKVLIEITPKKPLVLTLPEYYLVGNIQNWSPVEKTAPLFPTETDNKYTVTTDFSNSNAGTPNFKIWAADDFGTWAKALGAQTDGDTSLSGTLKENGGAILTPDNGIYTFTVDFTTNNYSLVKETNQTPTEFLTIGLIGEFNGWGDDLDMLPSSPHNWYYPGFVIETEGQIKFRADDKWDNSWGGVINLSETPFGISQFKSNDNMTIPTGTYDVLFNDITGRYAFYKK